MGADGIPGDLYKILCTHMAPFILEITNRISEGQAIPDAWKIGEITHIRKKKYHNWT